MKPQAPSHRQRSILPLLLCISVVVTLPLPLQAITPDPPAVGTDGGGGTLTRERVAALLEGDGPLPGSLSLKSLTVAHEIEARFEGGGGFMDIRVMHPRQAGAGVTWKGENLALHVLRTDVDPRFRQDAVAQLVVRLASQDGDWRWATRPAPGAATTAVSSPAVDRLAGLERAVATGASEHARSLAQSLLQEASVEGSEWRRGAVAMWRLGADDLAQAFAEGCVAALGAALETRKGTGRLATVEADRLRLSLAGCQGLAGNWTVSAESTAQVLASGRVGCDASKVVEVLLSAGRYDDAVRMAEHLATAGLRCDRATTGWAEALRLTGHSAAADARLKEGLQAWPESTRLRAALARLLLQQAEDAADVVEALDEAVVAVRRGPQAIPEVATLVRCGLSLNVPASDLADWEGALASAPQDPRALALAGLACLSTGRHGCAFGHFRDAMARVPGHRDLPGLTALAAMGTEDRTAADLALSDAWDLAPRSASTLAAARAHALRDADMVTADVLTPVYQRWVRWDVGPVPLERVPPEGHVIWWLWALLGILVAGAIGRWWRHREATP